MKDAPLVRGRHASEQLPGDVECLVGWQPADAPQEGFECFAVHVFHRQVMPALGFADVVDTAHIRVRDPTGETHFAGEALECLPAACAVEGHQLKRDRLSQLQIVGAIHLSHGAAAEQADDAVA